MKLQLCIALFVVALSTMGSPALQEGLSVRAENIGFDEPKNPIDSASPKPKNADQVDVDPVAESGSALQNTSSVPGKSTGAPVSPNQKTTLAPKASPNASKAESSMSTSGASASSTTIKTMLDVANFINCWMEVSSDLKNQPLEEFSELSIKSITESTTKDVETCFKIKSKPDTAQKKINSRTSFDEDDNDSEEEIPIKDALEEQVPPSENLSKLYLEFYQARITRQFSKDITERISLSHSTCLLS